MYVMFLYFIFVVLTGAFGGEDYCSPGYRRLCQGKGVHVACQFPARGPGPYCQNYTHVGLTTKIQDFITDDINRRRQRLAAGEVLVRDGERTPRPRAMMLVGWDQELAHLAQRLADQCQFVHDECRATVRYPYAGQSVGEVRLRRPRLNLRRLISHVVDAWWSERKHVRVDQLMSPFRPVKGLNWGHFSQLAIWNLRSVGCGAVVHGAVTLLLVCDFSHTNMLGQVTLRSGPVGDCPEGTARRRRREFPLLCAPISSNGYDMNEDLHEVPGVRKTLEYSRDEVNDGDVTKEFFEGRTLLSVKPKWRSTRTKWNQRAKSNILSASVLLRNRPVIIARSRLPSIALNLDKEDLEQLYRDTGFRVIYYENKPTSLNK